MTEPIPMCLPFEPINKELVCGHNVLTIQMTSDGSPGADVVKTRGNRIVVVDGPGSGIDGNRQSAEQAAALLLTTTTNPRDIAYQRLDVLGNFDLKAAHGGYFVYWVAENGVLRPIPGYIGVDDPKQSEVKSLRSSSMHDVRYAMMMPDGGLQLALHPDVIPSRGGEVVQNIIRGIEILSEQPRTFVERQEHVTRLLENFTYRLQIGGIEAIEKAYRPYVETHTNGDTWLDDDATFVLISMK